LAYSTLTAPFDGRDRHSALAGADTVVNSGTPILLVQGTIRP